MANEAPGTPRITSPEEFFGFRLGTDRKIARWDKITEYFYKLESESDRIKVIEMGKSTEGHPFLLVIISAQNNLARLEHYKAINAKIADPRGLSVEDVRELVEEGKAIVCQTMSLHATEIGGTQMAPELAYDLLSCDSETTQQILDNVIFLMVPCFNPDGQIMVTDWYYKYLGTEFEGTMLPYLYHKYAGHDNNRDAFALNLIESRYVAQILFREWHPHAYQDHHHMGSYGARLYIAPYCDVIRPYADPLGILGSTGSPTTTISQVCLQNRHRQNSPRRFTSIPTSSRAQARKPCPSTKLRPTSQTRGPAAGGHCGT